MDVDFRHLDYADGIGEDRLCLSILIACGVNLEFGSLGPLGVVVLEEAHKQTNRLVTLIFNGGADNTCAVTVQYEGLQADEFRGQRVDRCVRTVLEKHCPLLQRNSCSLILDLNNLCRQNLYICLSHRMLQLLNIFFKGIKLSLIDYGQFAPRLHLTIVTTYGNAALGSLHGVGVEVVFIRHSTQVIPDAKALFQQYNSRLQIGDVLRPLVL